MAAKLYIIRGAARIAVVLHDPAERGYVHEHADLILIHQQGSRLAAAVVVGVPAVVAAEARYTECIAAGRRVQFHAVAHRHAEQLLRIRRKDGLIIRLHTGSLVKVAHDIRSERFFDTAQGSLPAVDRICPALIKVDHIIPRCGGHIRARADRLRVAFRDILDLDMPVPVRFLCVHGLRLHQHIRHAENRRDKEHRKDDAKQRHAVLPPVHLCRDRDQAEIAPHSRHLPKSVSTPSDTRKIRSAVCAMLRLWVIRIMVCS